jgi:WD40 repeat protein
MPAPAIAEIITHLAKTKSGLPLGSRSLLESFAALASTANETRVATAVLRAEMGTRENKLTSQTALRQRLKRLNDKLSKSNATFRLKCSGGDVVVQSTSALDAKQHLDRVQAALTDMSNEATHVDRGGMVEPIAAPDAPSITVFFSYAWLPNKDQHEVQDRFFQDLADRLAHPPDEFSCLPKIQLWRDVQNLDPTDQGDRQIDAGCRRAPLAILMVSHRYPTRPTCMREANFFLKEDGTNQIGKAALVIAVNIDFRDMPRRFWANNRIVVRGPNGQNLVALWSRSTPADRLEFVDDVALRVLKYLKDHLATIASSTLSHTSIRSHSISSPPPQPTSASENFTPSHRGALNDPDTQGPRQTEPGDLVVNFATARNLADTTDTIPPHARRGLITQELTARSSSAEGVPIVDELVSWAASTSRHAPRLVALLGEFGMGKTITCQLFTQTLLKLRQKNPNIPLPIYFDLRGINSVEDGKADLSSLLQQMLKNESGEAPSPNEVISFARERGSIVIFDGLDEVTNRLSSDAAIRFYRQLLSIVPAETWSSDNAYRRRARNRQPVTKEKTDGKDGRRKRKRRQLPIDDDLMTGPRLIVSCRTHYFRDVTAQRSFLTGMDRSQVEADADIAAYFMLPFTDEQIENYLTIHLGASDAARALTLIERTYNLKELAERPILLKFIRETFRQLEEETLAGRSVNLAKLYDILVDQVLERDTPKHIVPIREKKLILRALALYLHVRGQNEIANNRLEEWFQRYTANRPLLIEALEKTDIGNLPLSEIFIHDLRNASLLVRPGERSFQFAHTSIREYFLSLALYEAACSSGYADRFSASHSTKDGSFLDTDQIDASETYERSFSPENESTPAPEHEDVPNRLVTWNINLPTPETLRFLLQRHPLEDLPERHCFELQLIRFLGGSFSLEIRRLAFEIWRLAEEVGAPLPRPPQMNLSGLNLNGAVLTGSDNRLLPLHNAVWTGANLQGATFDRVDFSEATFAGVTAPGTVWLSCRLDNTEFSDANLNGSKWRLCAIPSRLPQVARLENAIAIGCTIQDMDWRPQELPPSNALWRIRTKSFWTADSVFSGDAVRSHYDPVRSLVVAEVDGRSVVVSGSEDKAIRIFDLVTGEDLVRIKSHKSAIWGLSVCTLNGENVIISAGFDKTIRVTKVHPCVQLALIPAHRGPISTVAVTSRKGKPVIVSGSWDDTIRIFDLASGRQLAKIGGDEGEDGHHGAIMSVVVATRSGKPVIVSGSQDDTIRVFDLATGTQLTRIVGHQGMIMSVAATEIDGKSVLVSGGYDGTIRIFDSASGRQVSVIPGERENVNFVTVFQRNGRSVIVSATNTEIRLSDLVSGNQVGSIYCDEGPICCLAVAEKNDKLLIVSGSGDGIIRIFQLNPMTFAVDKQLSIHNSSGSRVGISRDKGGCEMLLSCSDQAWHYFAAEHTTAHTKALTDISEMPQVERCSKSDLRRS